MASALYPMRQSYVTRLPNDKELYFLSCQAKPCLVNGYLVMNGRIMSFVMNSWSLTLILINENLACYLTRQRLKVIRVLASPEKPENQKHNTRKTKLTQKKLCEQFHNHSEKGTLWNMFQGLHKLLLEYWLCLLSIEFCKFKISCFLSMSKEDLNGTCEFFILNSRFWRSLENSFPLW